MTTTWWERLQDDTQPLSTYAPLAKSWFQCAVGEARCREPGVVVLIGGAPEDQKLDRLGRKFYDAVYDNNRPRAKQLYLMIERRIIRLMQDSL